MDKNITNLLWMSKNILKKISAKKTVVQVPKTCLKCWKLEMVMRNHWRMVPFSSNLIDILYFIDRTSIDTKYIEIEWAHTNARSTFSVFKCMFVWFVWFVCCDFKWIYLNISFNITISYEIPFNKQLQPVFA